VASREEPAVIDAVEVLRRVEFLAMLDDDTLRELAARARRQTFAPGARILGELEAGADVYVIVDGDAAVTVEPRRGDVRELGTIGIGDAVGEMASLTGELRSATVTARTRVDVLVIADAEFDRLRARRPEVALVLCRVLARRLADADRQLADLSRPDATPAPPLPAPRGGSLARAWRELVTERRRDLAFLALAAFVLTLVAVRAGVYAAFRFDVRPRAILRIAYLSGFALLALSSLSALLSFRPWLRRIVAIAYGIGLALILNELGVTLAFDIFYKDIEHADPDVPFDIERLYRRTEAIRAVLYALALLVQAAYLRRFYRRVLLLAGARIKKLFVRRRAG
jgi:CRP/FNR family transcriptional regulator, cyclic AMP receptor protein